MMSEQQQRVRRIPCEVYSRIVGYLRPVQNWNKGKRQEWLDRKTYDPRKMMEGADERG